MTKYIKTPLFYSLIGAWNPQQVNKNRFMTLQQPSQNKMSKNVNERDKKTLLWREVETCVAPPFGGSKSWWQTEKPRFFFGIAIIFLFLLQCQVPANHCKTDFASVWARTRNPIQCFKSMRKPCQKSLAPNLISLSRGNPSPKNCMSKIKNSDDQCDSRCIFPLIKQI